MRHRLKATNPHKYSNSACIMKNLITLKIYYQNNNFVSPLRHRKEIVICLILLKICCREFHPFNQGLPVNPFSFGFPQMQQMHHPNMYSNICPPMNQPVFVSASVTSTTYTLVTSQSQYDIQTHSGRDHLNYFLYIHFCSYRRCY